MKQIILIFLVLFTFISCGSQAPILESEKYLTGHWKSETQNEYFSADHSYYSVFFGKTQFVGKWQVIKENLTENKVIVNIYDVRMTDEGKAIAKQYKEYFQGDPDAVTSENFTFQFNDDKKSIILLNEKLEQDRVLNYSDAVDKPAN